MVLTQLLFFLDILSSKFNPRKTNDTGVSRFDYPHALIAYLAHIKLSLSLRQIAKHTKQNPTSILRQIKKIEMKRDDPVYERILSEIEMKITGDASLLEINKLPEYLQNFRFGPDGMDMKQDEIKRLLRRLSESRAFILISPKLSDAGVFRESEDGILQRLAITERRIAEDLLLREWIAGHQGQNIGRYKITYQGRKILRELEDHTREDARHLRLSSTSSESPLAVLARKKDRNGAVYLTARHVSAGERLREDYEVSFVLLRSQDFWDKFVKLATSNEGIECPAEIQGSALANESYTRLCKAVGFIGPDLADIAFGCCCRLEGLESIERKLHWSARSGKIVLRIALERLADFYSLPESPSKASR